MILVSEEVLGMAASQVVLYFEKQEDALPFLAASSAMSAEGPVRGKEAGVKIANEICKASRITTEGVLEQQRRPEDEDRRKQPRHRVASG